jgi:GAF domain
VGTRTPIDGNTLAAMVKHTGGPARMDSYEESTGQLAAHIHAMGLRAAVGVPVIVDGGVWGLAAVGWAEPGPMPADTEARISGFAELIGTALVAGYRDEQKRQVLKDTSRRPSLIDSLLQGRIRDDCSLDEVAGYLRLRKDGRFVVIAAKVGSDDDEPLTAIESKLQSVDCIRHGSCCPIGRSGLSASNPNSNSTRLWPWCLGWRSTGLESVRDSTICARSRKLCTSPR